METKRVLKLGLVMLAVLISGGASAKDRMILPAYVLQAHTVAVVIDPDAGMSMQDPNANQIAQKDVETALLNWGRFLPMLSTQQADLVIVVRRGSGKMADATVTNPRQNNRPGVISPTDNGLSIGAQHGSPSGSVDDASNGGSGPRPQMEVGMADDSFAVYEGGGDDPLDRPAAWRWVRKNALHPHDVPAVDEFRKVIDQAEKQAAKQHP